MAEVLTYLEKREVEDWLIGYDSQEFYQLSLQLAQDWQQESRGTGLKILLVESDPIRFLASFVAACAAKCQIFLCNPNWVEQEWQQVFDLVQPDLILGQLNIPLQGKPDTTPTLQSKQKALIMIPTGGTSGKIRFAMHNWETLTASVRGFQQYFGHKQINSFCVLPLYHVSGLMQFMRSFTTGGKLIILPFKSVLEGSELLEPKDFFISLVPTQLSRLLTAKSAPWLSRFQTVLLGGAPAWKELLKQARNYNIPIALTYGMTETASQIATLKPEDFLKGNHSSGQVLPHAQVTIHREGKQLKINQIGLITIKAKSLMLGYYGDLEVKQLNFQPDDLGFLDEQGYLTIVGRNSNKIITGGENVFPAEVEAAIQATQLVLDVCVIGIPDSHWGQAITAVYVPQIETISCELVQVLLKNKLSKYKQPKYWLKVDKLPRNFQGKVNFEQLEKIVNQNMKSLTTA